ncbi:hypothetical protein IFT72_07565 [Frigoribacterium sp. CFBP 8754]|uniref:hypothetical protein n=1 Tax=Frigoribacterium sp. CFBP 8754 TaxID=2775290 RepID=UPI00177C2EC8|nr:hypothetical protein [Frigoribacterium sp. CFBP 8754]MBD8660047.1 hypothetical protein [Frigoribacterium sp. CFBP 8754]
MKVAQGVGREAPASWWGLVVAGVALITVGVGAFLAYSYWGWDGRTTSVAVISPPAGVVLIVWGIGRGARQVVHRMRRERAASRPADPVGVD